MGVRFRIYGEKEREKIWTQNGTKAKLLLLRPDKHVLQIVYEGFGNHLHEMADRKDCTWAHWNKFAFICAKTYVTERYD